VGKRRGSKGKEPSLYHSSESGRGTKVSADKRKKNSVGRLLVDEGGGRGVPEKEAGPLSYFTIRSGEIRLFVTSLTHGEEVTPALLASEGGFYGKKEGLARQTRGGNRPVIPVALGFSERKKEECSGPPLGALLREGTLKKESTTCGPGGMIKGRGKNLRYSHFTDGGGKD